VATRCDAPVITKKRTSSNETAGRSRTDSEISTGTTGEKGVTLELQALLLFAVERGVDLVKWFTPDDEAEKKVRLDEERRTAVANHQQKHYTAFLHNEQPSTRRFAPRLIPHLLISSPHPSS